MVNQDNKNTMIAINGRFHDKYERNVGEIQEYVKMVLLSRDTVSGNVFTCFQKSWVQISF